MSAMETRSRARPCSLDNMLFFFMNRRGNSNPGGLIVTVHMPPKDKKTKKSNPDDGLWIAPRYSLKAPAKQQQWELRPGAPPPTNSRLLELADAALQLWKPGAKKKSKTHNAA